MDLELLLTLMAVLYLVINMLSFVNTTLFYNGSTVFLYLKKRNYIKLGQVREKC